MRKSIIILCFTLLLSSCIVIEDPPTATIDPAGTETIAPTVTEDAAHTNTPTETSEPTETSTPVATNTSTATHTPISTSTNTPSPTSTATLTPVPLKLQTGVPLYLPNFGHPEQGCDWMGVAGQVFGSDGAPLLNQVILVRGELGGANIEVVSLTGTKEGDTYGTGGYEIVIATSPVTSSDVFSIQVFNLEGETLSNRYYFDTFNDCEQNLVIINFNEE